MSTEPNSQHRTEPSDGARTAARGNRKVVMICMAMLAVMGSVTAYSPTLYRIFCQVTGYGGTTQRAAVPSHRVIDRTMTVRFDANVAPGLPITFEPVQRTLNVKVGDNVLAFYRATNTSAEPVRMTAAFNVAPETMGLYFSKIACFCFTEQTLAPGQSVEMPLTFFLDPKLVDDPDTRKLSNVTLSYIFYPMDSDTTGAKSAAVRVGVEAGKGG